MSGSTLRSSSSQRCAVGLDGAGALHLLQRPARDIGGLERAQVLSSSASGWLAKSERRKPGVTHSCAS
jgi:hypothetical protein